MDWFCSRTNFSKATSRNSRKLELGGVGIMKENGASHREMLV